MRRPIWQDQPSKKEVPPNKRTTRSSEDGAHARLRSGTTSYSVDGGMIAAIAYYPTITSLRAAITSRIAAPILTGSIRAGSPYKITSCFNTPRPWMPSGPICDLCWAWNERKGREGRGAASGVGHGVCKGNFPYSR